MNIFLNTVIERRWSYSEISIGVLCMMHSGALATVPLFMLKVWFFISLSLKFRPLISCCMGMTGYLKRDVAWMWVCRWSAPGGLPEHAFKREFHLKGVGFIHSTSQKEAQEARTTGRLALEVGCWSKLRHWCRCTRVQVWTLLSQFLWILHLSAQTSQQHVSKSHLLITSL